MADNDQLLDRWIEINDRLTELRAVIDTKFDLLERLATVQLNQLPGFVEDVLAECDEHDAEFARLFTEFEQIDQVLSLNDKIQKPRQADQDIWGSLGKKKDE